MFGNNDNDETHKKINCPNCKKEIDEGLIFCPECGHRIPEFLRYNPD
jgi:DNA-directed RNA polymerase subunit RPC12/RpoP